MRRRPMVEGPLPEGAVEFEFNVPVPGRVVARQLWTTSALKEWPNEGPLDWQAVFGRRAPIVLDLGCGNGRWVLLSAIARPECDHLGVDSLPVVIRYARKRARQRGLGNVRFAVGDARDVVANRLAAQSIAEIHIYHPQPYYEPGQAHRRLITPAFLAQVHRALVPGGLLVLQTDNPAYWRYMLQVAPEFFEFAEHLEPWPDAPEGRTRREIIARLMGLPVFRGTGRPRADLDVEQAMRKAEGLPPPVFHADRRLMELDALERGERGPRGPAGTIRPRHRPRGGRRHGGGSRSRR